jgi:hypothetical protein
MGDAPGARRIHFLEKDDVALRSAGSDLNNLMALSARRPKAMLNETT